MGKFNKWLKCKIDDLQEQYEEYLSDLEDMAYENYREDI
jgi:hypothetical protein